MSQHFRDGKPYFTALREVRQFLPRNIPSILQLAPTSLELHFLNTIVLHWFLDLEWILIGFIIIKKCIPNTGNDNQHERIHLLPPQYALADDESRSSMWTFQNRSLGLKRNDVREYLPVSLLEATLSEEYTPTHKELVVPVHYWPFSNHQRSKACSEGSARQRIVDHDWSVARRHTMQFAL